MFDGGEDSIQIRVSIKLILAPFVGGPRSRPLEICIPNAQLEIYIFISSFSFSLFNFQQIIIYARGSGCRSIHTPSSSHLDSLLRSTIQTHTFDLPTHINT